MSENAQPTAPAPSGVSRRTVTKAMAWSVPVIAVAGTAPTAAASLIPCVRNIGTTGGTYPVTVNLSGCQNSTANPNHWDFNFKIAVAENDNSACDCDGYRVTVYDNPPRSRLGIQGGAVFSDWGTRTQANPRMYIQTEIAPGGSAIFPTTGQQVHRVAGTGTNQSNYGGWGFPGDFNLDITAPGTANDAVHALYTAGGGVPSGCGASGPFAYYRIDCRKGTTYTQIPGPGPEGTAEINPCIPMIQASVTCRVSTQGNDRYRIAISPINNDCSTPTSKFHVTNIQRNNDTNFPNEGQSVWSGDRVVNNSTSIDMASDGPSGTQNQLWISFHTGDPGSTSRIRIQIPNNVNNC